MPFNNSELKSNFEEPNDLDKDQTWENTYANQSLPSQPDQETLQGVPIFLPLDGKSVQNPVLPALMPYPHASLWKARCLSTHIQSRPQLPANLKTWFTIGNVLKTIVNCSLSANILECRQEHSRKECMNIHTMSSRKNLLNQVVNISTCLDILFTIWRV